MRHACAGDTRRADPGARGDGPATMGDVAKLAGVSQQTVSRVVNAREYVGGDTRERVLTAMRELSYRPNRAAQALVTGRSKTLGVISIDTVAFGPASVLLGLERAARAHGYFVSIARLAVARPRLAVPGARPAPAPARRGDPPQRRPGRDHARARPPPDGRPARRGRGHDGGHGADRRGRPGRGRGGGDAPAARSRPPQGRAYRRAAGLVVGAQAHGGLARGAGVGRGPGAAAAVRRLERALGLRARRRAGPGPRRDRDLRRQRRDGARRHARDVRGGPRGAGGRQHRRLRRRPLRALPDPAAHDRPPGLRGDRASAACTCC